MMIAKPIKGTLIFFCGKMGAGKTTLSRQIAHEKKAVLLSEDEWLGSLYPNQVSTLEDYVQYSHRLKPPMKALVQSMLTCGTNVVVDFPANTVSQRNWFRGICSEVSAPHDLVYLNVSDEQCLENIAQRRKEQRRRAKTDTPEMFAQVTQYFVPPSDEEGFTITYSRLEYPTR